jgi:glycosyltransferase involved in cell wall biosynthesis
MQRYKTALCRDHLPHAASVITVCAGIADEYARVFGIPRPKVVMNTPSLQLLTPRPVSPDRVRMVHHGGATRSRRIETMIHMLDHLDARFSLDLILMPSDPAYLTELRTLARGKDRVRFLDPVPMPEIPAMLNHYDLGLYLLEPNSFNNRHALPNKFFEFIQARLAIAIGPSPEMARLVREHDLGIVAEDFSARSLATALNTLTAERLQAYKTNAHRAASSLCWETESRVLGHEIDRLLALRPCVA